MFTLESLYEYLNQLSVVDCGAQFIGISAKISCSTKEGEVAIFGDCDSEGPVKYWGFSDCEDADYEDLDDEDQVTVN